MGFFLISHPFWDIPMSWTPPYLSPSMIVFSNHPWSAELQGTINALAAGKVEVYFVAFWVWATMLWHCFMTEVIQLAPKEFKSCNRKLGKPYIQCTSNRGKTHIPNNFFNIKLMSASRFFSKFDIPPILEFVFLAINWPSNHSDLWFCL